MGKYATKARMPTKHTKVKIGLRKPIPAAVGLATAARPPENFKRIFRAGETTRKNSIVEQETISDSVDNGETASITVFKLIMPT